MGSPREHMSVFRDKNDRARDGDLQWVGAHSSDSRVPDGRFFLVVAYNMMTCEKSTDGGTGHVRFRRLSGRRI